MGGTAEIQRSVTVHGEMGPRYADVLTPEALAFLAALDDTVAGRREEALRARRERRARLGAGTEELDFRPETASLRDDPTWRVPPAPADLADRRVEITGPPTPGTAVNALNSGAQGWVADFEDATTPTWSAVVEGQLTLTDALSGRLRVTGRLPVLHVRPRGWHLPEKHLWLDGRALSGSVVDAGLYLFHCARRQLERGSGPYLSLPKLESAAEARMWRDVLSLAEDLLDLPRGTVRTTVLIETLPAAFELEEILHALGPHASALSAGRWGYVSSAITTFSAAQAQHVLPDRATITMETPFLRAYTELLVATCHRRGAHAIGGTAALVPDHRDPERTARALERVRADKEREAADGFDGSGVAHPGLVPTCRGVFDAALGSAPNQLDRRRDDVRVTAADLLDTTSAPGAPTFAGLRDGISVALRYLQAWLGGSGAVTVDSLREDAATVEVIRSQIWQQARTRARLESGIRVTPEMVSDLVEAEAGRLDRSGQATEHLADAADLLLRMTTGATFIPFFTTHAYGRHIARPVCEDTRSAQPREPRAALRLPAQSGEPVLVASAAPAQPTAG